MKIARREKGVMLVELAMIAATLIILVVVALPRYFDLKMQSDIYTERQIAGSIRSGIQVYSSNFCKSGKCGYPAVLDSAAAGRCTRLNPCFGNVLNQVVTQDWAKTGDAAYKGPTGRIYRFTQDRGTFQ